MQPSFRKITGSLITLILAMFGAKASAMSAPQAPERENIAERVSAVRAQATNLVRQEATAPEASGTSAEPQQVAQWKKWKND